MKIIEFVLAFFAWLQIIASPLIPGLVIGYLVYEKYPTLKGIILGISISTFALIIGIIWASRVWKKHGTIEFMAKISSNSELSESDKETE